MPEVCRTVRFALLCMLLLPLASSAQVFRDTDDPLDAFAVADPRLRPSPSGATFDSAASELAPEVLAGWNGFLAGAGGAWKGYVDRHTGHIDYAEGAGIPWIAGAGNSLAEADGGGKVDLPRLEAIARAFLPRVSQMLGIDPAMLELSPGRSGRVGDHLWLVDFDVRYGGLTVEGARVVFRVNNGNLIQFGTENLPSPGVRTPPQQVGRKEALAVLSDHIGGLTALDRFVDGGTERLLPLATRDGWGRDLARVWEFTFRRRGSLGTWRARIDATTGEILEFRDANEYAQVSGGVYPESYIFNDETVRPMPFADVSSGGFTNSAGTYTNPGAAVTSSLSGQFVDINDVCGPISQTSAGFGHIAFGASAGTDCTTPGAGGAGNTHSARTQFYHLNRIKEVGRGWLPSNFWLSSQLPANVNLNATCNAFWDFSSVNFFKSGGGCGNTGEIAAISLHEYGHGLDTNDGAGFSFQGSEAYADVTAALMLHDSCMGPGFRTTNCGGYGDACTSCTGVRDIDWAKHVSNTPHTPDNFNRPFCGSCNGGFPHCESYVASESIWDLAVRDLPNPGSAEAWGITERLWYLSRPTATHAYTCNTSSIPWTSDGCSTGSWWRTMRAADDDDGNLANGTPHSCQLFAAFNRHGIACPSDPGANVCFSGCAPPAQPTLSLTPGNRQVTIAWSSSGPGVTYDVFRSEAGCDSGFVKIADGIAGAGHFDFDVANNLTYSYRVVAHASGNGACAAPPTECQQAMPQEPPCNTPPPPPTGVTATPQGVDSIAVAWNAVPGAVEYQVFRSLSSGGPWTQIGSAPAPATSYLDLGLTPLTTYFYVVRTATGESCISDDSDEASAITVACELTTLYDNDFETGSGLADWSVAELNGPGSASSWRGIQTCTAHSGSKIFRFGGLGCFDAYSPNHGAARPQGVAGFVVPFGSGSSELSFWHRYSFENGFDGGTLKISVDGGAYVQVPATALSGTTYNGQIVQDCEPPGTLGTPTFTSGQNSFTETVVDLDLACNAALGGSQGCGGHTVRVGFEAITDCIFQFQGWYIDDVSASTCSPIGCTGPPSIVSAATPADNQVLLSWNNGVPASTSYNVYRALGSCAAPGPFTRIATGVNTTSYLDSPVSGTTTYSYRVAGVDATGVCESHLSGCIDVVPTGPCTLPPNFAGLAAAEDSLLSTCLLELSWDPAASYCGGTVSYDVFRSTDPGFTPSAGNQIATGVTGTSFQDSGTLQYGTSYYYIVRAKDSVNGELDPNTVRRGATPSGPMIQEASFLEAFEATDGFDREGWTNTSVTGTPWLWSTAHSQTPTHSWHAPGQSFSSDRILTSPPVQVVAGSTLSFWHTYEFEACFDGGTLEVSEDGVKWASVPTFAFISGGYTEHIYGNGNPIFGRPAWCHGTLGAMTLVQVDLALWEGKTIKVRWHAGDDFSVSAPGWYVDSISFQNILVDDGCSTEPPPALDFYTLTPCRLLDTRTANTPALQPNQLRTFQLSGACGVPAEARALSVNVTAVEPGALGDLILFRADQTTPLASTISFRAGRNQANNAMVSLSPSGKMTVRANTASPVHLVLDVNGYYLEEEEE